jgi:hypothetical protein
VVVGSQRIVYGVVMGMTMLENRLGACVLLLLAGACGPEAGPEPGLDDTLGDGTASSGSVTGSGGFEVTSADASVSVGPTSTVSTSTSDATTDAPDTGGDESTGAPTRVGPTHLLVIRMPHGVFKEHVWTGSGDAFVLGPVLQPLAPWSDALVLVGGLENVILKPDDGLPSNGYGVNSSSILTGGLLGSAVTRPYAFPYYFGGGPSLDVVLGDVLGSETPIANVHLGVEATDALVPTGVSYVAADEPFPPMDSPTLAYDALFGGLTDPLLDELADDLMQPADTPGAVLELQLSIAYAAIALDVSRVQLLSIDQGLPAIVWSELGVLDGYHIVVAGMDPEPVRIVQTFWAERIAALLERLQATPVDGGNLLERTVIVWMSAEGSPPAAYPTHDVFAVIIDASGTFATGRITEVEADQADFAVTIAEAMAAPLPVFGHPDLQATVIDELLAR